MHEMSAKLKWNEMNEMRKMEHGMTETFRLFHLRFFFFFVQYLYQYQFHFHFHFHVSVQLLFNLSIGDIDTKVRRKLQNKV